MVSYRQLSSGQVILHERETSSSGRPKAQSLYQEDQFFSYIYTSTGGLRSKMPKSPAQQYDYWYKHNVKFKKTRKVNFSPVKGGGGVYVPKNKSK